MRYLHKLLTKKYSYIFLFFLFLLSCIPRILKLVGHEDYFGGDNAFDFMQTRSLVVNHMFILVSRAIGNVGSVGNFTHGAGWYYLFAIPFSLFGGHPFGVKLLMFVISIIVLLYGSLFLWFNLGKKEGLFGILFLGISPYLIYFATSISSPYVTPLVAIFYLHNLYLLFHKKKRINYFFLTVSLAVMAHFEIASFGFLLPSYLFISWYLIFNRILRIKDFLIASGILLLFFIPHIIFDITHNFMNLRGVLTSFLLTDRGNTGLDFTSTLANRYQLFKADIDQIFPTTHRRQLIVLLIFIPYGIVLYLKDRKITFEKKLFVKYLFGTIGLTWILLLLFPTKFASFWWITFLIVFHIFLAAIIYSYVFQAKNIAHKLLVIFTIYLFVSASFQDFTAQVRNETSLKNNKYIIAVQEPVEYIYSDSKNQSFRILYLTDRVLEYQYFLWYIGKTQYRDSVGFKNLNLQFVRDDRQYIHLNKSKQYSKFTKGLYYVIINNISSKESISNFYDQTFVTSLGKLIETKKFRNEDIIQKRILE